MRPPKGLVSHLHISRFWFMTKVNLLMIFAQVIGKDTRSTSKVEDSRPSTLSVNRREVGLNDLPHIYPCLSRELS